MIPRLIHQIWHSADLPDYACDSWQRLNPGWSWRLWTDADLLDLLHTHYPALEPLYLSYPKNVQRADLGRYLLLHHFGGIYADIDTQCLASLEPLAGESRIVLCEEPMEHWHHGIVLGLERLYFNGVMAGPAGHPFWAHLLRTVERCAPARDYVLESTGPLVLTGAVLDYGTPSDLALHSCHLFTPLTSEGYETAGTEQGLLAPLRLVNHDWRGSWVGSLGKRTGLARALKGYLRKTRYHLTRGPHLTRDHLQDTLDMEVLRRPVANGGNVAVLIPVRDAAPFLDRCFDLLSALDYPAEQLSVTFCEGDSRDDTLVRLNALCDRHADRFRQITVTQLSGGPELNRAQRWWPSLQLARRGHLARVRNHLIDHGLTPQDDWALWLDADVCDYDPGILRRLLSERRKVVTPDCRLEPDGNSYDLNAFTDPLERRDLRYYKHVHRGLYMPPARHGYRKHLHDLRFLHRVPLSSVGGTMLLVDANVHRCGLRFPDLPYDDLLETEGFGRSCRDFGVTPVGLPNVVIRHVVS